MANVYDIIIRPIITERSMAATSDKKYVFEVAPSAGGIIYASNGEDFAEVAGQKAKELQEEMAAELAKLG